MLPLLLITAGCLTQLHVDPAPTPEPQPGPEPVPVVTPRWVPVPVIRQVSSTGVVGDVESRAPRSSSGSLVTRAHEGAHFVHAEVRNAYMRQHDGRWNAFYVLDGRAAVAREPDTTIAAAAALVPPSLRLEGYDLYMVQQRMGAPPPPEYRGSGPFRGWNELPLYIADEFSAYLVGTVASLETEPSESEMVRTVTLGIYSLCVPMAARSDDPELCAFLRFQWERTLELAGKFNSPRVETILNTLRTADDAADLREFCRGYFGEWTQERLGF